MHKKDQPLFISSLVLIFIILLQSCASITSPTYGPVQDEGFQNAFLESIADDQQQVVFYSRAIWYPNKNGFKFLPVGKKSRKGILVCTDQSIYFAEWSANKYQPIFNVEYDQINTLRLAANELFPRVVIQTEHYNSFEILGVSGPELPNKEETDVVYQIIEQQKG